MSKPSLAHTWTVAFQGIEPKTITVQVQIAPGMPGFNIVGLPDKAVGESRERIRASFHSLGFSLPVRRITINLAPADLQKEGSHYDLPIALGLLDCMEIIPRGVITRYSALGEMGLDATLSAVAGILPAAIDACAQKRGLICPADCAAEALWSGNPEVIAAKNLLSLIRHFKGEQRIAPCVKPAPSGEGLAQPYAADISDIKGQTVAKRALEIAAAGGHNLLLIGPPGTGKSMLAARLSTILPPLTPQEALDVTVIHSIAGLIPKSGLVQQRPFRSPHHSASLPALVGGGARSKPGEISLAHHGVLFLDELAEFPRLLLESLRQPLETGVITVSRANHHVTWPARLQLIAAMNPCRCGFLGQCGRECHRAPSCGEDYQSKISGPLMDRFDLRIYMPAPSWDDLKGRDNGTAASENSAEVAARVTKARACQYTRYKASKLNAVSDGAELMTVTKLEGEAQKLLEQAYCKWNLSGRGYHRILRVARTIADLDEAQDIASCHLAEALQYRWQLGG